jgi:hemolysin-activating ACP:hemolysin acyltransferase
MVEVDCQKVLGVEKAWEYRMKMQEKVPNRIINVFHIEDGQKGLDRLIEFSDYIAISVPELRFIGKKNYLNQIAHYIKNKKPQIDIHLLGCTEKQKLKELNFCSSADSSSWISGVRYGQIETFNGKGHIKNLKKDVINSCFDKWLDVRNANFQYHNVPKNSEHLGILTLAAQESLKIYNNYAGNQI